MKAVLYRQPPNGNQGYEQELDVLKETETAWIASKNPEVFPQWKISKQDNSLKVKYPGEKAFRQPKGYGSYQFLRVEG